jgi:uncharacterized membrane protein
MNPNPYAAPAQAYAPPPPPPPTLGQPGMLDATETISTAWAIFKTKWGPLVGAWVLTSVITMVPGQAPNAAMQMSMKGSSTPPNFLNLGLVAGVAWVVLIALSTFFQVGMVRLVLQAARGETVNFSLLFSGADRFWPAFGVILLQTVLGLVGCALLIIPGLFVYLALSFSFFYVIDARMGPIEAMKASIGVVKAQWGQVFLFWLLSGFVMFAGALACCVGYFASVPLAQLAAGVAFIRISGRGVVPPVPAPGGWPAPAA